MGVGITNPTLLNKAVERYNMYRSPEATAKLIEIENEKFAVEFSGVFCKTCGIRDWLEDLIYELKDIDPKIDAELTNWKMSSDEKIIAEFKLKINKTGEATPQESL